MSKDIPEAFETFEFDLPPIRGFPELRWAGKRPFKSTQYFPAQKRESYGDPTDGWWNRIYWGDNLQVMSHLLRDFRGKVDLVYIDPPFDSKVDYRKEIRIKGASAHSDGSAFEEMQYADIWSNDQYCQFVYERIALCRELLSENGSIFFHCDSHRGHHIRLILDEIFGPDKFHNCITWRRSHAQGNSGQGAKFFGRVSDYLYLYSKSGNPVWNDQFVPYTEEILNRDYKHVDPESGEKYRLVPVDGPGGAAKGNPYYTFLGVSGYWRYSQAKMQDLYDAGEIILSSTGKSLSRKKFLKDAKGTAVLDIWDDVSRISPGSSERVDYPTQKPERLLQRVISTCSEQGGLVFDCFMGSGTTQAVAMKLGRRFIGADINLGAIETTIKRLNATRRDIGGGSNDLVSGGATAPEKYYLGFELYNVNNYDLFRNPVEAKELIREAMELQPLPASSAFDGQREGYLVKIMPVNRIATRQDLNEVINGLDFKAFERRQAGAPNKPVERIHLVCMGHEPDLGPALQKEAKPFDIEVMVTDLIRDKAHLHFKRASDARLAIENGELVIKGFYPMNLLQKLSLESDAVVDWRQLVESVKVDFHYDGAVLTPAIVDAPSKDELVAGRYSIPADAGTIRVKITDLLSESWEGETENG
ncbi:site-specific DNA-methyltransferase [Sphingopyxis sp. USTB-05]|uniref:site-specific DNA-methyltransferase n=1 Tax=Sphingopyxis sp. USTB-05 TaxID=2830667 RepID=UPI00207915F9|nr:site-specific DNA-methyltransferase [Sphingopyxis sp. USTB-05]USI79103.1 site-specific DNA-methyltransferase [Sphingopyxis sp. USTB-05]